MSLNNMGKSIPMSARQNGYDYIRSLGVSEPEAFSLVEAVSNNLERDQPYEAQRIGMKVLDLTGYYVMMAYLLTF